MKAIFNNDIRKEEFNIVIAIASTNMAQSSTGLTFNMIKKWPEDAKKTIFTAHCPSIVKMEMDLSAAENRLLNPTANNLPTLLYKEKTEKTHLEKDNISLGCIQYTKRSTTPQVRTRVQRCATSLPSITKDSTKMGYRNKHGVV